MHVYKILVRLVSEEKSQTLGSNEYGSIFWFDLEFGISFH